MEENKKNKNKKILVIIIAVITLLLVGLGAFFLLNKDDKNANKNDDNRQENKQEIEKEKITPLMYEITKEGSDNKIYLFGSMHLVNLNEFDFPSYVMDAYNDSDYLACEFDIIEYEKNLNAQEYLKGMMYLDGTTIKDHIEKESYAKLVNFLKEHKIYNEALEVYNTYFFDSLISELAYKDSGLSEGGVDSYFLKKAKNDNKIILEVETPEFQNNLLKSFPERLYEMSIVDMIDNYQETVGDARKLYSAWKSGNANTLEELALEDIKDDDREYTEEDLNMIDDYNNKLLRDRNIGMAEKLVEYFEKDEDVFFMVGAAHLIGDEGIASLVEAKGYKVVAVNK